MSTLKNAAHPQREYVKAGSPHGPLNRRHPRMKCWRCQQQLVAYSDAGVAEWSITGFCEPCFDVVTTPDGEETWPDSSQA